MNFGFYISGCTFLIVTICISSTAIGQQSLILITARDDGGVSATDTCGFHIYGTYCNDGFLVGGIVEEELPPKPPPGYFDLRFVEHRTGSSCIGVGQRVDLQEFYKRDTFKLEFQPGPGGYPIYFSWRLECPDQEYAVLRDLSGGALVDVDMVTDTSVTVSDTAIHSLLIIAEYTSYFDCYTAVPDGLPPPLPYTLATNYPNPFNPSTQISYFLPSATTVSLKIFDVLGREVATLVNARQGVGKHSIQWNAEGLPGGVYFYRMVTGEYAETKKMVLLK